MRDSDNLPSWRKMYPFASHECMLEAIRMHYVDEGQGDVLLFVHGNPTWSFYWRNLILALRGQYRNVAPDHIGCGLSDKPANYPYTLSQHVRNLMSLIEDLDLSGITLVAHDWGGAIGLGAAVEMPERFGRFVLFNTGAFPPSFIPLRLRVCRIPLLGRIAIQGFNAFACGAIKMASAKPDRLTADVRAGLLAPYDGWSQRIANYQFVRDIPASARHPTWQVLQDLENRLPSLADRPVQFLWGMRDWCFTPACLDRMLASFPHAEVHRIEDAGHYVVEDAHERIIPLMADFLTRFPLGFKQVQDA